MAKRYQLSEFGRTTKKPKLDISINNGRPPMFGSTASNTPAADAARNGFGNGAITNFWDDDDDDVILLATQVAESQVAAATATSRSGIDQTFIDITFSEFAPHVHAQTSTQRPLLTHFLDDGDDDDFAIVAAAVEQQQQTCEAEGARFKKPSVIVSSQHRCEDAFAMPRMSQKLQSSQVPPATEMQSQSEARRQLASERQIKFLMERVDVLKKENSKMVKNLEENKVKMESKEGEASLLRDELRHMKQQMQTLRMEKIFSTEAAKSECNTKIAELHKEVEAKETALQLKAVECSRLKMRHADETQRLETTLRDVSHINIDSDAAQNPTSTARNECPSRATLRCLMRLRGLQLTEHPEDSSAPSAERSFTFGESLYANTLQSGASRKQRTLFQIEFTHLQMVVAKWQLLEQQNCATANETQRLVETVVASACKVFPEFWSYVHGLTFPMNCRFHPYHEYNLQQEQGSHHDSLLQQDELFAGECVISLRRYVAVLAVLCGQQPSLAQAMLSHHHGEYQLLQIASDAIRKLSYSREICDHFGVLEAFAKLLHCLLLQLPVTDRKFSHDGTCAISKEYYECEAGERIVLLTSLMTQLVFTRPSAWVLRELSACLLVARPLHLAMGKLCWNSAEKTFLADRVQSIYRYRSDTCMLQVYAGLLEIAFPPHVQMHDAHVALLAAICANHVRFVYQCFTEPPFFIRQGMPIDYLDLDEVEGSGDEQRKPAGVQEPPSGGVAMDESTSLDSSITSNSVGVDFPDTAAPSEMDGFKTVKWENSERPCICYRKLCLSVVTLIFQLLRQWLRHDNASDTVPQVVAISQVGVQLLHIIFCDNYNSQLFGDSEETTKHHLYLICKWWTENTSRLGFNDIHVSLLKKLQNSHVVPKPLSDEDTRDNVMKDLDAWYRVVPSDHSAATTSSNAASETKDIIAKLRLVESAASPETFFECLRGYAFNFE